jgi:methionyl-tRNA formyltransferase
VRVVFLGNDPWSVPALESIATDAEIRVTLVVTNPPRPAGRGAQLTATAVADASERLGLPLLETGRVTGALEAIREARPDVLVVVAYGQILPGELLRLAPLGAVNLHFSLLPRWRGAAPVQRAILAGDDVTGVTVMQMDEGLDTGPILASLREPIRPDDDAGSLGHRLAWNGAPFLVATLRALQAGSLHPRPQDDRSATLAPKLSPEDRRVDWSEPAIAVVRRVRALAPEPAAATTFRGDPLKVLQAALSPAAESDSASEPGAIVGARGDGVAVGTGEGVVVLLDVVPAGRSRMSAAEWMRGVRPAAGERLG